MKGSLPASRHRAGAIHLAASALVTAAVFLLTFWVWYPKGLFAAAGGREIFFLIAATTLVAGPLLTFIVFIPGKKGLAFDLFAIAFVQLAAVAYGFHVLLESRPAYVVFVKDRFELVRANEIPQPDLHKRHAGPYDELALTGPRVVGARIPADPDEVARLIFAAAAGVDLQYFPQHYVDYDSVREEVRRRAGTMSRLRSLNPGASREIGRLLVDLGRQEKEVGFLPLRAGKRELTALIDAKGADLIRIVELHPW